MLAGSYRSSGATSGRKASRKRSRGRFLYCLFIQLVEYQMILIIGCCLSIYLYAVDIEFLPLMEGEGKHLRVLGFNQSQRATFVQVLMRFSIDLVISFHSVSRVCFYCTTLYCGSYWLIVKSGLTVFCLFPLWHFACTGFV